MADERKLAEVLAKLNEVMAEAERLRREVSRQLTEQRASQQQQVTPPPSGKPTPRKR